jgi:hypothetical protein
VTKNLPRWAFGVLAVAGVALAGSMFLNWIDAGGVFSMRGITLAWEANHWLFLVPIAGLVLAAAAATRSQHTRLAALAAGIAVTGYTMFDLAKSVLSSGLDTWLILGGAGVMLAGAAKERFALRAIGGLAVIVGFIAPWADFSMFKLLTSDMMSALGWSYRLLWLVPAAGVLGVISAGSAATGGKLAVIAGVAVYGVFVYLIGAGALAVFGLGAWIALGASAVALVIAVLARDGAAALPAAVAKKAA